MTNKLIGYARVSTSDQNTDRQEIELLNHGVRKDDLYIDSGVSGMKAVRPALEKVFQALERGDTLVVVALDRLGRSTAHMLDLAEKLQKNGIALRVLNFGGMEVDTSTAMGKMVFTVMSALGEMELEIKRERLISSIDARKRSGGNLGGRPPLINDDHVLGIKRDVENGVSVAEACRRRNVARGSYYRKLKEITATDLAA